MRRTKNYIKKVERDTGLYNYYWGEYGSYDVHGALNKLYPGIVIDKTDEIENTEYFEYVAKGRRHYIVQSTIRIDVDGFAQETYIFGRKQRHEDVMLLRELRHLEIDIALGYSSRVLFVAFAVTKNIGLTSHAARYKKSGI